jgi:hypothetical protein
MMTFLIINDERLYYPVLNDHPIRKGEYLKVNNKIYKVACVTYLVEEGEVEILCHKSV